MPKKSAGSSTPYHALASTMSNRMTSHSNLLTNLSSTASTSAPLHPDHANRPIWTLPTGTIILETQSPLYSKAYDFLVTIAEPVARPSHLHTYNLTPYSLYAASAVSMTSAVIVSTLERLSKSPLPENVKGFIAKCTSRYGKVKLVLKEGRMYVEASANEEGMGILRTLSGNRDIGKARVRRDAKKEEEKERNEAREGLGAAEGGEDDDDGFEEGEGGGCGAAVGVSRCENPLSPTFLTLVNKTTLPCLSLRHGSPHQALSTPRSRTTLSQ